MDINVFLFCFFVFLQIEREREWYIKFGYNGEIAPKLLILFFDGVPLENLSFFHGLIDFILFFYTGLKNLGSLVSQIFFCLQPGVNGYGSVCHEPFPITKISSRFFRWQGDGCHFRFRAPANHLASPFLPPWSGDFVRATRCHPSQVTVNSNSSHPTSTVSVEYHVTISIRLDHVQK